MSLEQDIEFLHATASMIRSGRLQGSTASADEVDAIADRLSERLIPFYGNVNDKDRKLA